MASGSLSLMKSTRTAQRRRTRVKEKNDKMAIDDEEANNGGSGFSVPSPNNNCEGGIDSVIEGDIC